MSKIKNFFIKLFNIPIDIYIKWDRYEKVYKMKLGKRGEYHIYTSFRALKGGIYNSLIEIGDRPFTLVCSKRLVNRLFEPEREKWDI